MTAARRLAALAAAALALTGCGLARRPASGGVALLVTRDYGAETLVHAAGRPGRTNALALLRANAAVTLAGAAVASVDGVAANGRARWSYWVDGVRQSGPAGSYTVADGDVVQFDYDAAPAETAIVGAYPNPFVQGPGGKRLPVHVECESDASVACGLVRRRLTSLGVVPAAAELGLGADAGTLRVLVARWPAIAGLVATGRVALDPTRSGVFARFGRSGRALELLDTSGAPARTVAAGAGLVAALAPPSNALAWLVTGVDEAGVERAAHALDAPKLAGAFAVAATAAGVERLPLPRR